MGWTIIIIIFILVGRWAKFCLFLEEKNEYIEKKINVDYVGGVGLFLMFCVFIFFLCVVSSTITPKEHGAWESLSEEEKEWYERNYGDGKMESINKAIEDYKSSH